MAEFRLAATAENQIDDILIRSEAKFGTLARERYAALLVVAMHHVADIPSETWFHGSGYRLEISGSII